VDWQGAWQKDTATEGATPGRECGDGWRRELFGEKALAFKQSRLSRRSRADAWWRWSESDRSVWFRLQQRQLGVCV
jgi:hypothetical protein